MHSVAIQTDKEAKCTASISDQYLAVLQCEMRGLSCVVNRKRWNMSKLSRCLSNCNRAAARELLCAEHT